MDEHGEYAVSITGGNGHFLQEGCVDRDALPGEQLDKSLRKAIEVHFKVVQKDSACVHLSPGVTDCALLNGFHYREGIVYAGFIHEVAVKPGLKFLKGESGPRGKRLHLVFQESKIRLRGLRQKHRAVQEVRKGAIHSAAPDGQAPGQVAEGDEICGILSGEEPPKEVKPVLLEFLVFREGAGDSIEIINDDNKLCLSHLRDPIHRGGQGVAMSVCRLRPDLKQFLADLNIDDPRKVRRFRLPKLTGHPVRDAHVRKIPDEVQTGEGDNVVLIKVLPEGGIFCDLKRLKQFLRVTGAVVVGCQHLRGKGFAKLLRAGNAEQIIRPATLNLFVDEAEEAGLVHVVVPADVCKPVCSGTQVSSQWSERPPFQ